MYEIITSQLTSNMQSQPIDSFIQTFPTLYTDINLGPASQGREVSESRYNLRHMAELYTWNGGCISGVLSIRVAIIISGVGLGAGGPEL